MGKNLLISGLDKCEHFRALIELSKVHRIMLESGQMPFASKIRITVSGCCKILPTNI